MASILVPRWSFKKPCLGPVTKRRPDPSFLLATAARMESSAVSGSTATEDPVVQYLVLRRDLIDSLSLGSVLRQGSSAAVAAIWENRDDPFTIFYCSPPNVDSMRKVTLEVKGEAQILNLSEKLKNGGIAHKLWTEESHKLLVCLASKPCQKSVVSSFFKKLKLCSAVPRTTLPLIDPSSTDEATQSTKADKLVQYLVVRRDIMETWPLGSIVTQACHASVAAIWEHKEDPHTINYCSSSNPDSTSKVIFEVNSEDEMTRLSDKLKEGAIAHKLWIEQPENIPTCLATKPYPEPLLSSSFNETNLCK